MKEKQMQVAYYKLTELKELCDKSCMVESWYIHLARLRKGPVTEPCKNCRKGIKNTYKVCMGCGRHTLLTREQSFGKKYEGFKFSY